MGREVIMRMFSPLSTILLAGFLSTSIAYASAGELLWKLPTNGGYIASSPALGVDGTVFLGSSSGTVYVGSFDTSIYAFASDGTVKWRFQTGRLIRSTPAPASDSTIVVGSYDGYLYALDPDGSLKWKFKASAGIATSPLIAIDGTICFGDTAGKVYLLSANGSLLWDFVTGGEIHWSSPAADVDGTFYIGSWDGYLYAVDTGTGAGIADTPWPKFHRDPANSGRM